MLDQAITDYTLIAISDMRAAGLAICTQCTLGFTALASSRA